MNLTMIEHITWIDSGHQFASSWASKDWIVDHANDWTGENESVGFVVHEDESKIVLVQTRDNENPNYAGAFVIWKPCIVRRRKL